MRHCTFFQNRECEYFPCHETPDLEHFSCLFCFCPLYHLGENCGGDDRIQHGVKDCSRCLYPHDPAHYDEIIEKLKGAASL